MAFHCALTGDDIHVINTWTYATSAERLAATGFTADDVHKIAVQENDHSIWVLVDHSPITWQLLGGVPEHNRLHEMTNVLDHEAGNYKVFYSDGSGHVQELALGADGTFLKSQGASAAPTFEEPAASVFGTQYQQATSEGVSSTTSATYQQKLRLTTTSLPAGTYMIQYSWEFNGNNNHGWSRAQLNDTTDLNEDRYDSSQVDYILITGFALQSLSGVNTIDIDFRANSGGDTMLIRRARIALWRVS